MTFIMDKTVSVVGKAFFLSAVTATLLSSCIKEEALNAEADIMGVTLGDNSQLLREPVISNNDITLYANTADSILSPEFVLTDGATIEPASGTPRKFFTRVPNPQNENGEDSINLAIPQEYTVTSQDGKWKKTYTVRIANNATPIDYHFDNIRYYGFDGQDYFHVFYETIGGSHVDWGSGNAGAMITLAASNPSFADYPTSQADGGQSGKCAKLTTISTGALGTMFGAPIAAGNIFLGTFSVNMSDMASSTHFGIPFFNTKPVSLTGYYKYKAGEVVTDKKMNVVEGAKDDFALYAVLFEVTDDVPWLDGRDGKSSSLNSPNIVLKAELVDRKETDEWTRFEIPFEQMNGKEFDYQKMVGGKYSFAIVASSSKDGALFKGAVGSTLYIDEFHVNYE